MTQRTTFPTLRWLALAWLAVWIPAYARYWGWQNFLLFCDIAVLLTCLGLWRGSALLLSSQAVAAIVPNLLWMLDAGWRALLGRHLIGGTEYMWDVQYPQWVRLLSLFHVVWPLLLVWAVRRTGYDARGFALQSGLAAAIMLASRVAAEAFTPPMNLNFVLSDPIFKLTWGPPPVHLAVHLGVLICVIYWPTHLALRRLLPPAPRAGSAGTN